MEENRRRVLVLKGQSAGNAPLIDALRAIADVVEVDLMDQAVDLLRHDHFDAIFSDSAGFLPLERALVSQQASVILNTIGEGICIVDGEARCNWMNKKMQAWPAKVHEKIRRSCQEAFQLFSTQVAPTPPTSAPLEPSAPLPASLPQASPAPPGGPLPAFNRSKRYTLNVEDQQYLEMVASPVISPAGQVVQVAAVVWDVSGPRRMQQKIDAIDKAGRELVRLDAEALGKLNVQQRLKLLEDKIIGYTRELLHFDHFAIRLLDRRTRKLEVVISVGLPMDAVQVELFAEQEGNGISGFVAATGKSYLCPDVERDPRYVKGLDHAMSSLTVPLSLQDSVIGIFNVESCQRGAFNEDDRQFAEIFGRYVAIALNILNLMVVERMGTAHKVADDVFAEVVGPLNDIALDAESLIADYIGNDEMREKIKQIAQNVQTIRQSIKQAAAGPQQTILGMGEMKVEDDPLIAGSHILIADDSDDIRQTIEHILRKYRAEVTVTRNGAEAIVELDRHDFHLVISDIAMPDKNGYDVFAAARKKSQHTPVILMTGFGYDPNHSIVRASQEGLQAVLFKPFRVNQMLSEVRRALTPSSNGH